MRSNAPKYKLCDRCRRNYHKVAVRRPDGTVDGFCPSCYNGKYNTGLREHLATDGSTIVYDRRARKPEWTAERHAELALREEMLENFPYGDPFADQALLLSYKRNITRLLQEVVV